MKFFWATTWKNFLKFKKIKYVNCRVNSLLNTRKNISNSHKFHWDNQSLSNLIMEAPVCRGFGQNNCLLFLGKVLELFSNFPSFLAFKDFLKIPKTPSQYLSALFIACAAHLSIHQLNFCATKSEKNVLCNSKKHSTNP